MFGLNKSTNKEKNMQVEQIEFISDLEKRVAFATVNIGAVSIRGITVWRAGNGRLRVFLPSFRKAYRYADVISISPDLREELDAEVIAAYKVAKSEAQKNEKQ
jgi:DNA-binding cell septation regulator SpoVG